MKGYIVWVAAPCDSDDSSSRVCVCVCVCVLETHELTDGAGFQFSIQISEYADVHLQSVSYLHPRVQLKGKRKCVGR